MLGIDDDSLARASLAVYLLPLLGFFLGLLVGISLFGSELAGGLTGLLGLGVCFVGIRFFGPFGQASCQPVILRKIN
jgi:positive regulator of sigma E activity